MTLIPCPNCGSTAHWAACEMQTWLTPCDLVRAPTGIEVEIEPMQEVKRDMASAVTTAYVCTAPECGYALEPDRLSDVLKEASVGDEEPVRQPGEGETEFNLRKGRWGAEQLEQRKRAEHEATPKESPIVKLGRVFGGSDA